jgi:hypothetical protein
MKTKTQIQSELVELEYILEKLQIEQFNGYADNEQEIKNISVKISTLEWVIKKN